MIDDVCACFVCGAETGTCLHGNNRAIRLNDGIHFAIVDSVDFERLRHFSWSYVWNPTARTGYAFRTEGGRRGRKRTWMHREILGTPDGFEVDHDNHDGLDNRRSNIASVTKFQNQRNRTKTRANASGFKGVSWHSASGKWAAGIGFDGRKLHLGLFDSPEDAAEAYAEAAKIHHGEFARC